MYSFTWEPNGWNDPSHPRGLGLILFAPPLALSAGVFEEDREMVLAAGMNDFQGGQWNSAYSNIKRY